MITFYKILHGHTPCYISVVVPSTIGDNWNRSWYIQLPMANRNAYYNSFSSNREWNFLPLEVLELNSTAAFRLYLDLGINYQPKYFSVGERKAQVLHIRLPTHCCFPNSVLSNRNIIDSPVCRYDQFEDTHYYVLNCPYFANERNVLFAFLSQTCTPSLQAILFEDEELPY